MKGEKKIRYLVNEMQGGNYIKCWKERREIMVIVWLNKNAPEGEADGDWAMPGILGISTAIAQAVLQTEK
jgi:hypothetical protein